MSIPSFAFVVAQCPIVMGSGPQVAIMLYQMAHGNPCTPGCSFYNDEQCEHFQRLRQVPQNFEMQAIQSIASNADLMTLATALSATTDISEKKVLYGLYLIGNTDTLQIRPSEEIWDLLKGDYSGEDGVIDIQKLAETVQKKLKGIGLLE